MWAVTIALLITAAGVLYFDGAVAGLSVAAIGSAALLAALRWGNRAPGADNQLSLHVVQTPAPARLFFAAFERKAS